MVVLFILFQKEHFTLRKEKKEEKKLYNSKGKLDSVY